mgnify:CR=1 FL=1|jgi:hypothetical protein
MRIPEDMLWPIKLLIEEKPHLFSRKTKKQFIRYWEKEIHWITGRRGKNYMIESAMSQGIKLNKKDIPTQNKQDKIILMFDFYPIENEERKTEITTAIQNNINNDLFDELIMFVECSEEESKKLTSCFELTDKVKVVPNSKRTTYRSAIDYAKKINDKDAVFLLTNNDCYFDETVELLKKIDFKNGKRVLAMTRKDLLETGEIVNSVNPDIDGYSHDIEVSDEGEIDKKVDYRKGHLIGPESSDAWAFKSNFHETKAKLDHEMGRYHCEQQFLGRIYEDGYDVRNVGFCGHIRCIHIHQSFYRKVDTMIIDESDTEYYNNDYMIDFWKEGNSKPTRNWDNYVVNSNMNFHKNNYFIDDRLSGQFGKFVVRDIRDLF